MPPAAIIALDVDQKGRLILLVEDASRHLDVARCVNRQLISNTILVDGIVTICIFAQPPVIPHADSAGRIPVIGPADL